VFCTSSIPRLNRLPSARTRRPSAPDPAAFSELLRLSALVGECLGVSARSLADGGSWANVADVAGVTRQAAWSRWRCETISAASCSAYGSASQVRGTRSLLSILKRPDLLAADISAQRA
jgi:hypothetical protein